MIATEHVIELFKAEEVSNVGLEEVEFDPDYGQWLITVGFSRPWDYPTNAIAVMSGGEGGRPKRSYKVLTIRDDDGSVLSIKNREASD